DGAEDDAERRQPDEAKPGQVADRLDGDDKVADAAADERAVGKELPGEGRFGSGLVAEHGEEHPAQQAAERPEAGVEVDARDQAHRLALPGGLYSPLGTRAIAAAAHESHRADGTHGLPSFTQRRGLNIGGSGPVRRTSLLFWSRHTKWLCSAGTPGTPR